MRTIMAAVVLGALTVGAAAQSDAEPTAQVKRGETLLERLCASCHAIGPAGTSPDAKAPAFRTLGQRYKIETLEEALGEGLISGHPDMPEFRLNGREVGEAIAYLNAIQQR
jgi:cytochrome c